MPQFEPGMYFMSTPTMGTANSKNGKPFLFLQGNITHVSINGEPIAVPDVSERTVRLFLSDAAFPYTMDRLKPLEFNGDFVEPKLGGEHLKGVWVECSHETYEGKVQERWQLPGGGGGVEHEQLDSETVRRLTALRDNHERNSKAAPSGPIPF